MNYQKLFDHMNGEHGLTLLEGEMMEIINVVREMDKPNGQLPGIGSKRPLHEYISQGLDGYIHKRDGWKEGSGMYECYDLLVREFTKLQELSQAACASEKGGEKAVRDGECEHPKAIYHRGYICEKCKVAL